MQPSKGKAESASAWKRALCNVCNDPQIGMRSTEATKESNFASEIIKMSEDLAGREGLTSSKLLLSPLKGGFGLGSLKNEFCLDLSEVRIKSYIIKQDNY